MILQQKCLGIGHVWSQAGGDIKILGDLSGIKCRNPGQGSGGQGAEVIWSQGEQVKNPRPAFLAGHTT